MRKRIGAAVVALVLGATLSGCWVQRGFDAGRTNWNGFETELRSNTVHRLSQVWDGYVSGNGVNAPITVDGVVYVTTYSGVAAAFEAASGAVRWRRSFYDPRVGAAPVLGDPAWHAGQLLVPAMTMQSTGGLLRLDPTDGSTVSGDLTGEPTTSVAVADDEVATMSGTAMPSGLGTAHVSWRFEPAVAFAPSARVGDFAVVGERVAWSLGTQALGFSAACPPYPEGWFVTGCAPDWSTDLGGQPTSPAAVGTDGVVYADDSGTVTVLDAATGDVRWTGEAGASVVQAPAVAGDDVVVATADGRVMAFASTGCTAPTCPPLWEAALAANPVAAPVAGGDVVYVATSDGTIAAFDVDGCRADTCSPVATIWVGSVTGGPIVHDGLLIVGTSDGHVVALGLPTQG